MDEDRLRGIIRRGFIHAPRRKGYFIDPVNKVLETMTNEEKELFYNDPDLLDAFDLAWWDFFLNGSGESDDIDFIVTSMKSMLPEGGIKNE